MSRNALSDRRPNLGDDRYVTEVLEFAAEQRGETEQAKSPLKYPLTTQ